MTQFIVTDSSAWSPRHFSVRTTEHTTLHTQFALSSLGSFPLQSNSSRPLRDTESEGYSRQRWPCA